MQKSIREKIKKIDDINKEIIENTRSENVIKEIDENLTQTGAIIKENIAELRTM